MSGDPYYAVATMVGSPMINVLGRGRTHDQATAILARLHAMGGVITTRVLVDLGVLPMDDEQGLTEVLMTDPVLRAVYELGLRQGQREAEQRDRG